MTLFANFLATLKQIIQLLLTPNTKLSSNLKLICAIGNLVACDMFIFLSVPSLFPSKCLFFGIFWTFQMVITCSVLFLKLLIQPQKMQNYFSFRMTIFKIKSRNKVNFEMLFPKIWFSAFSTSNAHIFSNFDHRVLQLVLKWSKHSLLSFDWSKNMMSLGTESQNVSHTYLEAYRKKLKIAFELHFSQLFSEYSRWLRRKIYLCRRQHVI